MNSEKIDKQLNLALEVSEQEYFINLQLWKNCYDKVEMELISLSEKSSGFISEVLRT